MFPIEVIYGSFTYSSKHWSCRRGQQREWIGERDQVDIVMATGGVCLGVETPFYCACLRGRGGLGRVIYTPCDMNATQHTGLSSGLHDILVFLGIISRFVKISAPHHLRSKITNVRETCAVQCCPLISLLLLLNHFLIDFVSCCFSLNYLLIFVTVVSNIIKIGGRWY